MTKIMEIKPSTKVALAVGVLAMALVLALGVPAITQAHDDPAECSANGVGLSMTVYRADGVTPVGGGSVTTGETINYEATLSHLGGANCNFEGGTLSITTPDGTVNTVASPATPVVPLVEAGSPFVAPQQSYVVDAGDVNGGVLDAVADYTGGESHTPNQHQSAQAGVDISTPFALTESRIVTEVHDTDHTDITNSVVTFGTDVHDMAAVSGTEEGGIPTGDVTFELMTGLVCDGQTIAGPEVVALDGNGEAESTEQVDLAQGEYSYLASYGGDENYDAAVAECEPFTIADSLIVEKTVETSFDRDWDWTIEKSADQTDLLLTEGEMSTVNYEVTLDATSEDTNYQVSGTITVTNPEGNPDATVESISDELDVAGAAEVLCDQELPFVLVAGASINCTYSADSDGTDTENTATVTTSGDVPGGSDVEPVSFEGDPANETDECVLVNDDNPGFPGPDVLICQDDEDKTIEYSVTFGPEGEESVDVAVVCGENNHPNLADFITNDNEETGSDDWNVAIAVECETGCTLTQGYWKTHSANGPAPEDEGGAWDAAGGPDSEFLNSGMSWYDVFWTPPKGGNVWIQLAHQWMAAYLNMLNGASLPGDVETALNDAQTWLEAHSAGEGLKGKDAPEAQEWQQILGSYNEGIVGPGHCEDEE